MIKHFFTTAMAFLVGFLPFAVASGYLLPDFAQDDVSPEAPSVTVRRVNVPYNVPADEAAIFWFGQVTLSKNYTDVRIRYTDDHLLLALGIMDRLLWYDTTPSAGELTAWDSVSLYLCQDGNVGQAPTAGCFRFDAQLDWWEPDRADFQAAYQGDGSQWVLTPMTFTTSAGWNGNAPNDNADDRGWMLSYTIPFASLGLSMPPARDSVWGFGLAIHDRDSLAGPPLADQVWPETLETLHPATWGQLTFGLKPPYVPAPALPRATTVIRHGLNGVEVIDVDVGGSSVCGEEAAPDFFPTWGDLNYSGKEFLNIQHLDPISEWPCFSKYYVTFPLGSLPEGKVVLSATLTLYQFGNAGEGWDPGPRPSFIQAYTVEEDWEEDALTWNTAPLAGDYVAATWVDPLDALPPWPGIPRFWDVSGAVAKAYAAGEPLRLALYSPDWAIHSGKYFYSSDIGGGGEGRPTLSVLWGDPAPDLLKMASSVSAEYGDTITYTLGIRGDGSPLTITDTLPSGLGAVNVLTWIGTVIQPSYDGTGHLLTWGDSPPEGQPVTLTYSAEVIVETPAALMNSAVLMGTGGSPLEASAMVIANPFRVALPLIIKRN
jgi:hypothetical protein